MSRPMSLGARAALALVLMLLFFALAVAAIVGLTWLGWTVGSWLEFVRGKALIAVGLLALACFAGAAVIAWSILPRFDRFEPPGPELTSADAPELMSEIRRVAAQVAQREPAHVYLVGDLNAFVTERGGVMGLGSRRVMGIGLPLLTLVTVAELRAILAHEFGHFHGGDTKLGPWIYKTRGAVGRTVVNLARSQGALGETGYGEIAIIAGLLAAVRKPFEWFGIGFLRITQAISRHQEYAADALAARCFGSAAMASGLEKVATGSLAYSVFVQSELDAVLQAGFRPPVADGFRRYLAVPATIELRAGVLGEMLAGERADPYDSHPPLAERVAAARKLACPTRMPDDRPALDLVADVDGLERRLLEHGADGAELAPLPWAQQFSRVIEPAWRRQAAPAARALGGLPPARWPRDPRSLDRMLRAAHGDVADQVEDADLVGWAASLYGVALSLALLDHGWSPTIEIGEPVRFADAGRSIEPFRLARDYLAGELDEAAWSDAVAAWGVGGDDAALAPSATA